jgi:hypothetical protein
MKNYAILIALLGFTLLFTNETFAQRKNVSNKEVTGTFKTADGANSVKIFAVGRGGLDRPGYNLQVEFFASLKLGPTGEANGNTGTLSGYAPINGDTATFTPDDQEPDQCNITIKFVKLGQIKITQEGTCGFVSDLISTEGTYKRTSATKPKFTE